MARRSIRRGQAISPWGVGSLVDFPGESLMAAGLDAWPEEPECRLFDHRLQRRLKVEFFRQPPPWAERAPSFLPFVRFPRWHFCPRCRHMTKVKASEQNPRCSSDHPTRRGKLKLAPCSTAFPERRRPRLIPVRFVVACEEGHVEDFPWIEWVHGEPKKPLAWEMSCGKPVLLQESAGHGGLRGVLIRCTGCGKARTLVGAGGRRGLPGLRCRGCRPWLGDNRVSCGNPIRLLERGATNLYFPRRLSSILIPPYSTRLYSLLENPRVRRALELDDPDSEIHPEAIKAVAREHRVAPEDLEEAIVRSRTATRPEAARPSDADYRYDEYQALLSRTPDLEGNLVVSEQPLEQSSMKRYFGRLVLVEKLAETQVLVGFSRIEPPSLASDEVQWSELSLRGRRQRWLPAYRVFGEGIFITLRRDVIGRWRQQREVLAAAERIQRRLERRSRASGRQMTPEFLLLHSLAHLLIRRLSFECGYGASALRERLYCRIPPGAYGEGAPQANAGSGGWMCGVLVYTAAGDSEGTLGGLVHQGKAERLEFVLKNALSEALWCASDPLCRESTGQGSDSLNLAACHTCTLLPETSCEEGNRLLDRLLLVGSAGDARPGYFRELVEALLEMPDRA